MTKEEFLLDTLEYYTADTTRRAVSETGFCRLKTIDGRKCALGRFIPDEIYDEAFEKFTVGDLIEGRILNDEIIDLDKQFLIKVQGLHDLYGNWYTEKGITELGKYKLDEIIEGFHLDKSQFEKYLND